MVSSVQNGSNSVTVIPVPKTLTQKPSALNSAAFIKNGNGNLAFQQLKQAAFGLLKSDFANPKMYAAVALVALELIMAFGWFAPPVGIALGVAGLLWQGRSLNKASQLFQSVAAKNPKGLVANVAPVVSTIRNPDKFIPAYNKLIDTVAQSAGGAKDKLIKLFSINPTGKTAAMLKNFILLKGEFATSRVARVLRLPFQSGALRRIPILGPLMLLGSAIGHYVFIKSRVGTTPLNGLKVNA
ncbi:MAG: hypothetical protein KTR14_07690 [Vampirovibrio sp.]|nr:hypothetical protein [Vampirovibrio sp.]